MRVRCIPRLAISKNTTCFATTVAAYYASQGRLFALRVCGTVARRASGLRCRLSRCTASRALGGSLVPFSGCLFVDAFFRDHFCLVCVSVCIICRNFVICVSFFFRCLLVRLRCSFGKRRTRVVCAVYMCYRIMVESSCLMDRRLPVAVQLN